ncbi:MAG: tetratricopeptide repeat protein [Verrucomicrobiota bacterium]
MIEITDNSLHDHSGELNHAAYRLGCEHYNATNFYMASTAFVESLEYWPEDPQAWMALGNCFDEIGNPKEAEYCYRKSVELSPGKDISKVRYNLANSIFDQNRFEEAIILYRMIPEDDPVSNQAQKNLTLAIDLLRKQNAEQVADDQLPSRIESET